MTEGIEKTTSPRGQEISYPSHAMTAFARAQSAFLLLLTCAACLPGQSQALDAQIEGIVEDANGSVVSAATITATNVETGASRSVTSRENGAYRLPILTLSKYSVVAEHPGFKRFEREGVVLSAGQTAVVDITLQIGALVETVTVNSDVPIAALTKNEIGRLINSR